MHRLVLVFMVIGLFWVSPADVVARQDELSVVASTASTDSELAGLFPVSVGGQRLAVESWSGADWAARLDPMDPEEAVVIAAIEPLLATSGSALDEVEVASASVDLGLDGEMTIGAVRVPGSRAYGFVDAAVGVLVPGATGPSAGWGCAGDRWIALHVRRGVPEDRLVVAYPAADTVWVIDAHAERDTSTVERVQPIIEALPPQFGVIGPIVPLPQRVEVPALGIAASFPEDWAVETLPATTEAQALIDRSLSRSGIDAEWLGTVSAIGPAGSDLGATPMCHLMVFGQTELAPRAWISAVTEDNPFYLVDETPAGLVSARIRPSDRGRGWAPSQGGVEHFALGHEEEIVYLNCWSKEPPGERGSAIAETIEFLPAEE